MGLYIDMSIYSYMYTHTNIYIYIYSRQSGIVPSSVYDHDGLPWLPTLDFQAR